MKKLMFSALAAFAFISCSSDDTEETTTGGFSNNPVSGVVYSQEFTFGGGTASPVTANGEEMLYIHLGRTSMDCDSDADTPIWIIVPEAVGDYTVQDGATIQFSDEESGAFGGGFGTRVEIISITDTTVKGRVMSEGFYPEENSVNGTFEVPYCGIE